MRYITATQAAHILGYTTARALTKIFQDPEKCPACVQRVGGKWIVPMDWVERYKAHLADMGITHGTTGCPLGRKKIDYKNI